MSHEEFIFNAQVLGFDIPHVLNTNELFIQHPLTIFIDYIKKYNPVLPDNMIIDSHVNLDRTNISELPDNLTVRGYLAIENVNIQELPKNLYVKGSLYISGTKITNVLECTKVLGEIIKDF